VTQWNFVKIEEAVFYVVCKRRANRHRGVDVKLGGLRDTRMAFGCGSLPQNISRHKTRLGFLA
jgi:hypothetical protein